MIACIAATCPNASESFFLIFACRSLTDRNPRSSRTLRRSWDADTLWSDLLFPACQFYFAKRTIPSEETERDKRCRERQKQRQRDSNRERRFGNLAELIAKSLVVSNTYFKRQRDAAWEWRREKTQKRETEWKRQRDSWQPRQARRD
jgi:hypothetical protein